MKSKHLLWNVMQENWSSVSTQLKHSVDQIGDGQEIPRVL